jgi:hypothetical protein
MEVTMAVTHPAAHTTAPAAPKVNAAAANKFLVTPQSPISGGDALPVGIKIASAWFKNSNPASISATLQWNGTEIAIFTVGTLALGKLDQDVKFATRIKIPAETTKGTLSVEVTANGGQPLKGDQSIDLEINRCSDCSSPDHRQLVLATQPAPFVNKKAVAVKSYVPKPMTTSRVLKRIDCVFNRPGDQPLAPPPPGPLPAYEVIGVEVKNPGLLADEVFLAADFMPSESGALEMLWTYKTDDNVNTDLQARAYLTQAS